MSFKLARGVLIAIEGIDGAGKTTQTRALASRLSSSGLSVITSKEPTDGPWGMKIRESAASGRMPPEEELEAFIEDRKSHVKSLIEPALADGKVVIVDRYYFSTAAYQGARGMDHLELISRNEQFAPRPDILFILDVDPVIGVYRIRGRGDRENHFEREAELAKANAIFKRIEGTHVHRLDGMLPIRHLTHTMCDIILRGPVFKELCAKSNYKTECEPAFCSIQMADVCKWITVYSLSQPADDPDNQPSRQHTTLLLDGDR